MKVYYQCAPCFLRQAKEALELATSDSRLRLEIMEEVVQLLANKFKAGAPSNAIGTGIHRLIKEKTNNPDPYLDEKKRGNLIAEKFEPKILAALEEDPTLKNYIKAAIVGNLLDFAAMGVNFDPSSILLKKLKEPIVLDHSQELEQALNECQSLIYLADNAGEIVFDKLLLEKIKSYGLDITVALKAKPILNDATIEDALEIGLDRFSKLTTIGTDSVGIIAEEISPDFKKELEKTDLIISKGMGNYEGLTEMELGEKLVFSLLNVKCGAISQDIGIEEGSAAVIRIN